MIGFPFEPKISTKIKNLIKLVLEVQDINTRAKQVEVSVLLTNDKHIAKLNDKYRQKNKPTNVLSFPCDIIADSNAMPSVEEPTSLFTGLAPIYDFFPSRHRHFTERTYYE